MVLFGVCSLLLSVNSIIAAFYTGSGAHQMGSWQAKLACVAWRFWLGAPSNKGGRGQRNRVEIGAGAIFIFLAASPFVLARLAREFRGPRFRRSCARLDKTAMLRRLRLGLSLRNCLPPPPLPLHNNVRTRVQHYLQYIQNMRWKSKLQLTTSWPG